MISYELVGEMVLNGEDRSSVSEPREAMIKCYIDLVRDKQLHSHEPVIKDVF